MEKVSKAPLTDFPVWVTPQTEMAKQNCLPLTQMIPLYFVHPRAKPYDQLVEATRDMDELHAYELECRDSSAHKEEDYSMMQYFMHMKHYHQNW